MSVEVTPSTPEAAPETAAAIVDKVLEAKTDKGAPVDSKAAPEAAKTAPEEGSPKVDEKKEVLPETPPKVEDSKMAQKFAALSKREKEARAREKALEAREKALAAKEAPPAAKEPEKAPLKLRMKQDPFNTLKEEFGLDLESLTQIAKNEGKLTEHMQLKLKQEESEASLREEINALKKSLADKEEAEKTAKQKEAEAKAFAEFKGSIESHIKSAASDYELLGLEEDAAQIVYDVIEAHYQATKGQVDEDQPEVGKILSIKEAADYVESHLLEEAKKYTSLSKIKGLFASTPATEAAKQAAAPAEPEKTKTLSNEQNSVAPSIKKKPQTREEELAEAIALIKFNN